VGLHKTANDYRRSELAKIHIAKAQLGLDDDTYHDILWTLSRVKSSADLDSQGRFKLLAHFPFQISWMEIKPEKTG
jgi:phage gp16-like protein